MKKWTVIAVGMLVAFPMWAQPVFNPDNGHYYEFVFGDDERWEWPDARTAAEQMEYQGTPGHLVTITSQDEQDFLYDNFVQDFNDRVWIGGSDEGSEGSWWWVTGEPWDYENWAAGQGGPDENCLIFYDTTFEWHDDDCFDGHNYFIVEFDLDPVPTLPGPGLIGLALLLLVGACWWWLRR